MRLSLQTLKIGLKSKKGINTHLQRENRLQSFVVANWTSLYLITRGKYNEKSYANNF